MFKKRLISLIKNLKKGQKIFTEDIASLVNTILLTIVYFLGVGLTSLVAKLFKKHFLDYKLNYISKTYWEDLNLSKNKLEEYYRQF